MQVSGTVARAVDPQGHGQDATICWLAPARKRGMAQRLTDAADNPFATTGVTCGPDPHRFGRNCKGDLRMGLRNPCRWSFDSSTGELWGGRRGQNAYEEIDKITRGGNDG